MNKEFINEIGNSVKNFMGEDFVKMFAASVGTFLAMRSFTVIVRETPGKEINDDDKLNQEEE